MSPRRETASLRRALARAIRERRSELGLSQESMSHEAQVDRTCMSGLESGARNPTIETILRVAEALGMKPSELLASAESGIGKRRS